MGWLGGQVVHKMENLRRRCGFRPMSFLVQPRLVNGPFGDPGLYLGFRYVRRAILFDLGDVTPLSPRELLRVSHVLVSHAHMDHVAGLDRLLRICLRRSAPLTLIGPKGFVDQIEHRLRSFTWNLLDADAIDFRLLAYAFDADRIAEAAEFAAREAFARRSLPLPHDPPGVALAEEALAVRAVALDHGTPSLAFALREADQMNVWRTGLDALGLPVGPWLNRAKQAARRGLPDHHPVETSGRSNISLGALREHVFRISPGRLIAYVTDAADTAENRRRIEELAAGADHLFIEAVFLERDRHLAQATRHLTAMAAGQIARRCRARQVTVFHHSARYEDDEDALVREMHEAWRPNGPARI